MCDLDLILCSSIVGPSPTLQRPRAGLFATIRSIRAPAPAAAAAPQPQPQPATVSRGRGRANSTPQHALYVRHRRRSAAAPERLDQIHGRPTTTTTTTTTTTSSHPGSTNPRRAERGHSTRVMDCHDTRRSRLRCGSLDPGGFSGPSADSASRRGQRDTTTGPARHDETSTSRRHDTTARCHGHRDPNTQPLRLIRQSRRRPAVARDCPNPTTGRNPTSARPAALIVGDATDHSS